MLDLIREFETIIPLPDDIKLYILRQLQEEHYCKNDYLLKAGQICRNLYFVRKGIIYGFFIYRGVNRAMRFAQENELCFVPESFLKQIPSKENLRAIFDSVVYVLPYDAMQNICSFFPKFHLVIDHYFLKDYVEATSCLYMFRSFDGFHRYKWLKDNRPDLLEGFPMKKIASYITMSATSLGRYIKRDTGQSKQAAKRGAQSA